MSSTVLPSNSTILNKLVAYLAGSMEFAGPDDGLDWRLEYRKELKKLNIDCIIPHEEESKMKPVLTQEELKEMKVNDLQGYIEHYRKHFIIPDINIVRSPEVDMLIVRWNGERVSGTIHEVGEAFLIGKPVYLVTNQEIIDVPGWFLSCCTETFNSLSCLLNFLVKKSFYK